MRRLKDFIVFCLKISLLQFITYVIFGLTFSVLLHYKEIWNEPIIKDYLKDFSSKWLMIGPLIQPIRGLLISLILWFIIDFFHETKKGWLKLWGVFVIIGIICTPMSSPGSMEGFIYSKLPIWFHLIMLPEVLLQTLLLSITIIFWDKKRYNMK